MKVVYLLRLLNTKKAIGQKIKVLKMISLDFLKDA